MKVGVQGRVIDAGGVNRVAYACDVGSTRSDGKRGAQSGFGWARAERADDVEGGRSITRLVAAVAHDLSLGRSVALGFEAPLFIPVPLDAANLCRGRAGEGSRSFAAPAGLAVTALGLHQAAWVLAALRETPHRPRFAYRSSEWPSDTPTLFCWEAFVSGPAHSDDHVRDAATAVVAFLAAESDLAAATTVHAERPLSLIGAAALWSGWVTDSDVLHAATAVIRPSTAFAGTFRLVDGVAAL
jgi:hypothetical protein